ncbi:predicted protein [Nematostella vectensis]|uniref:Uncharacterized protein n=1 Tax=Nematostella vectensis TaxID=45351 RepID=A7S5Z3_NEMVE|nr:predicted protein [Nematostella vectensis]|eukprot:XP_001632909.1 predicted protein [Nematostella vectensis]
MAVGNEPEDHSLLETILEKEGSKNSNILMSYLGTVSGTVGGAVRKVKHVAVPDVWPDMERVDHLVFVWTCVGYGVGTATAIGISYLLMRTTREIGQWRSWRQFRSRNN